MYISYPRYSRSVRYCFILLHPAPMVVFMHITSFIWLGRNCQRAWWSSLHERHVSLKAIVLKRGEQVTVSKHMYGVLYYVSDNLARLTTKQHELLNQS
ncbi:hypothetical protein BDV35DRAFT_209500 [Aspergillus flavus]|uniref:Uncharacterized protein n=1 Tax=Aspergillus flavus TaxID=5059 RepID=A0A5N6H1K5_ASPFL|nr:hypothetical protein BDV35DRAFT_209500 [Aspergillus flavus]